MSLMVISRDVMYQRCLRALLCSRLMQAGGDSQGRNRRCRPRGRSSRPTHRRSSAAPRASRSPRHLHEHGARLAELGQQRALRAMRWGAYRRGGRRRDDLPAATHGVVEGLADPAHRPDIPERARQLSFRHLDAGAASSRSASKDTDVSPNRDQMSTPGQRIRGECSRRPERCSWLLTPNQATRTPST